MKINKLHIALVLMSVIFLCNCGESAKPVKTLGAIKTESVSDSLGYEMENSGKVYAQISIESPVVEDELSRKNFATWLSTVVEREKSTDKDAVHSLAKAFVTTAAANLKNDYVNLDEESRRKHKELYVRVKIYKIYDDDQYVTYMFEEEEESGGLHPYRKSIGYTFNRSDFSLADLIESVDTYYYRSEITKCLGEELVDDASKLMNVLQIDDKSKSEGKVPLPANGAYFVDDSLIFKYQEYEIASYNYGMPVVKLPYKKSE